MKNVLSKLATARLFIKSHPIKKDGRNAFSKYDYFTPELVSKMVNDACNEANIICVFSLKQDSLGYYGEVITTDLETGEAISTETRTAKPLITATNETQQMGGMNTYAKRYSLMSLFDIEDNTIDFDSQDNSKPTPPPAKQDDGKPWLNKTDKAGTLTPTWLAVVKALQGGHTVASVKTKYKVSKENETELLTIKPA